MVVEVRCPKCGKLGMETEIDGGEVYVVCPQCGYRDMVIGIDEVIDATR